MNMFGVLNTPMKSQYLRYPWCKSEALINAPPEFVLQKLWDAAGRFEYDEYAKKERCAVIQKVVKVCVFGDASQLNLPSD